MKSRHFAHIVIITPISHTFYANSPKSPTNTPNSPISSVSATLHSLPPCHPSHQQSVHPHLTHSGFTRYTRVARFVHGTHFTCFIFNSLAYAPPRFTCSTHFIQPTHPPTHPLLSFHVIYPLDLLDGLTSPKSPCFTHFPTPIHFRLPLSILLSSPSPYSIPQVPLLPHFTQASLTSLSYHPLLTKSPQQP